MKRFLPQDYQKFTPIRAKRIGMLAQQALIDVVLNRIVWPAASGAPLAIGATAYFPNGAFIEYDSVDRQTGAVCRITAGLGLKRATEANADEVAAKPIVVLVDTQLSPLVASDPTNGRVDRIFARPLLVANNPTNVEIIDPLTENVTAVSLNQNEEWRYEIAIATGVPSASPPAGMAGIPVSWLLEDEIARVTVLAGAGSIASNDIEDRRVLFEIADGLTPGISSLPAGSIVVSPVVNGQANVQGSLTDLNARIVSINTSGLLVGAFQYVNTTSVRLRRTLRNLIAAEISGSVITSAVDITFEFPTHLDTGAEAPSTFYYCYLENTGGTLTPHISVTPPTVNPDAGGGQFYGYHPAHPTWRFLQAFYNDDASNIVPFYPGPEQGQLLLRSRVAGTSANFWRIVVGAGLSMTTYSSIDLTPKLPRGIRLAHLHAVSAGNEVVYVYGPEELVGLNVASNPALWQSRGLMGGASAEDHATTIPVDLPLDPADATPSLAWGTIDDGGANSFENNIHILGWRF